MNLFIQKVMTMTEDIKAKLKEKLMSELSEPSDTEPMTEEPETQDEEQLETVERMTFEEFDMLMRSQFPFNLAVQSADKLIAQKLQLELSDIEDSKITTAVLYVPYWYLAPYLSFEGTEIPPQFKPLLEAVMKLGMKKLLEGGFKNAPSPV